MTRSFKTETLILRLRRIGLGLLITFLGVGSIAAVLMPLYVLFALDDPGGAFISGMLGVPASLLGALGISKAARL
jgi:hypothetical protein